MSLRNRTVSILRVWALAVAFGGATLAAKVHAEDAPPPSSAAVEKAMDARIEQVAIAGRAIPDALAELGTKAGVRIGVDDAAMDLLPWGRETKVADLKAENATLREILPQVLGALGLSAEERAGDLMVVASPALMRINRRASWDDLRLLRKCNDTAYSAEAFGEFKLQYRISAKVDAPGMLAAQMAKAGQGTIAQILEVATGSLGWTWFPDNDHLVVMTLEAQYAHRLARRVTVRYNNTPLSTILVDLAKRANIGLSLEPGMMLKLPQATAQSYTLSLQQSSIRQAFEVICAETGLKYEIDRDGVRMAVSEESSGASALVSLAQRTNYVGKISVPSKDGSFAYEFLVRESEVPKDILEYRKQIIGAVIEKMRAEMAPDNSIKSPAPTPEKDKTP